MADTTDDKDIKDIVKNVADKTEEHAGKKATEPEVCPKCGNPLSDITTTATGRKLQRCSAGSWDPTERKTIGCDYVKWLEVEPQELDEKCPKCGSPLVLSVTRFGKKMKKCSTNVWDKEAKKATGCDYIEWINGTTEKLDEECPACGKPLVLFTTNAGKRMKKCSTAGWDREKRVATGCTFVQWLRPGEYEKADTGGEEFLPPEPKG
ncbi:MAG: topoisomerase DNA-binding C4 zinc finger domain-containing protein [Candidatus Levybacteria bacterium]|nr:topoisomerase DNA-binding C4 zinc finger domain-containing protein [Candidatus Levybacteria bacterium]